MYVKEISLLNYRNINSLDLKLSPNINIFYGDNAQGKTNFLEAIYLSGTGRSHRTNFDKELISFNETEAHIKTIVKNDNIVDKIDVHLKQNEKKGIAINSVPIKKLGDLFGIMLVVIFSPEDLALIKAGPSERRRFMDMEICQLSKIYYFHLQQYYKILRQRNKLLKSIKHNKSLINTLDIWDLQLVEYGKKIIVTREKFVKKINLISKKIHGNITNKKEELEIIYKPNVSINDFEKKLKKNYERDIFMGTTNIGVHKDDLQILVNNNDVRIYGSQGQQRTCSLSLKLAEIQLIKEEKNTTPILLLDDVLSELDFNRQKYLLENIKSIQTIITCTGVEDILKKIKEETFLFHVNEGKIFYKKKF